MLPLINSITDNALSQAMPDHRQIMLQLIDAMNLMSVTNVSVHATMPKEDILEFNVTQKYTNN